MNLTKLRIQIDEENIRKEGKEFLYLKGRESKNGKVRNKPRILTES